MSILSVGVEKCGVDVEEKVSNTRVRLTEILEGLKISISALAITMGFGAIGIEAYRINTGQSELEDNIQVSTNPEILTEIGLLFFGSAVALLGVGMNLMDLRRRWVDNRLVFLTGEKQREKNEFLRALEEMNALKMALEERVKELENLRVELEEAITTHLARISSLQNNVIELNNQLRENAITIRSLQSEIGRLENEVAMLRVRIGRFEQYEDATLCVQALEMASQMREMADIFLRASKFGVNINGQGPNGAYLIFGVNPDLTQNLGITRKDLELMTAQWLGDNVPKEQRTYNQAVLLPLLEQFEKAESMMKQGLLESAYTTLLKLRGKIELLTEMNQGVEGEFTSPEMEWRSYAMGESLPVEWLEDEGGKLINFFNVLKIKPISQWSEEFKTLVKSTFRELSKEKHSDKGGDDNEFKKIILAKKVLENERDFEKYFKAYQKFNTLFI